MNIKTSFCLVLAILAVASTPNSSPEKLLLSVKVSGHGMTWTWALDYVVFLRNDGTFVYTALDGTVPSLHVRTLSEAQTLSIVEKAHAISKGNTKLKRRKISDCSLEIEIKDDAAKEFKASGVECDLVGVSPKIVDLLCGLDVLRGDAKGITSAEDCKNADVRPTPAPRNN